MRLRIRFGFRKRSLALAIVLCGSGFFAFAVWKTGSTADPENQPIVWATTPISRASLLALQERVQSVNERVLPTVVACEIHEGGSPNGKEKRRGAFQSYASGVIITADGIVLSQAHVTHPPNGPAGKRRQPGERTTVILSNGRKIDAELLGACLGPDVSLLRLLEPGPYPHAPLDPTAEVKLGDWIIKLGHPIGFRSDRPPVVRAGRVLYVQDDMFVSDCQITGGDSGGPYFDLEGRLVGLPYSNVVPWRIHDALSPPEPRGIGPGSCTPNRVIQKYLDQMIHGEVVPFSQAEYKKYSESFRGAVDGMLPRNQWTGGRITVNVFRDAIQDTRRSLVAVLDETNHTVAEGIIQSADGDIVTLASTLPAKPRCQISSDQDSRVVDAEIVGMDAAFDLALLKVTVSNLPAIRWSEKQVPAAGTFLASVGFSEVPQAIGIVSVSQRDLQGPFRTSVMKPRSYAPNSGNPSRPEPYTHRPAVFGFPRNKHYMVNMSAPETGIEPGDVIVSIAGRAIVVDTDLRDACQNLLPGEKLAVRLIRDGVEQEISARLSPTPMIGSTSYAEFPTLFEHDMRLFMSPLGAPVVDLEGQAIGITVYRGDYGCIAIPGECVKRLSSELKTRKGGDIRGAN